MRDMEKSQILTVFRGLESLATSRFEDLRSQWMTCPQRRTMRNLRRGKEPVRRTLRECRKIMPFAASWAHLMRCASGSSSTPVVEGNFTALPNFCR